MLGKFVLNKETKDALISEIQSYFYEERGEELGDLAALLILEFFMDKLAPHFYNLGIADAQKYLTGKLDDMYELEK
ncbi:DUF2164 domain-containing protein [Mesobacillus zeae]|uniref:DUF2164 domain-containing protein n=1 Tax=Mesobacillus zeae TaxID=1917180 RepID=A0A398B4G8_9BACI|nr:DUF2164 domain-containing protein [Mesobacillus zeae]RID84949.1 DUF2164 domain-containing protein [Mesobacillus zeae]